MVQYILRDQYAGAQITDPLQQARRDRLSAIAKAVIDAFNQRDWSPSTMLKQLSSAVNGRHILAWSSDPVEQKGWVGAGMAGTLARDSLMVGINNFSGTKLDQFINVEATLTAVPDDKGSNMTLDLRIENDAPLGLAPYVSGPYPGTGNVEGEYKGQVAVNLPAAAGNISLSGTAPLTVSGVDGPTQVDSAAIDLKRGEHRDVVIKFRLPAGAKEIEVEPSARYPAIRWHFNGQNWQDTASRSITW